MKYDMLNNLSGVLILVTVTLVFSMLFEPRYSKRQYLKSLVPFLSILFLINFYLIFKNGFAAYGKVTVLVATIPSLVYFFITAKSRDGRFFFTFCLVDTSSILLAIVTGFLDYTFGGEGVINFVLRLIICPTVLYVIWHRARLPYLNILHTVKNGWWLFTAITVVAYALLIFISAYPITLRERPDDMPSAILTIVLLPLVYFVIFYVLNSQQKLHDMGSLQHAFSLQSDMMETRAKEIQNAEEKLRIERHDLRHQLKIIEELAIKGDIREMLTYLGSVEQNFNEFNIQHYCTNPILDAIISYYFRQAAEAGIQVEHHLNIPENLPVSHTELATVFANALENAIHANLLIPESKRKIIFNCISHPTLMFEIMNPYTGEVMFDAKGLPISQNDGHGYGSKSVYAFCQKYDATYVYETKNQLFRLVISL